MGGGGGGGCFGASGAQPVLQEAVGLGVLQQHVGHVQELVLVGQFIMCVNVLAVRQKLLQILTGARRRFVMRHSDKTQNQSVHIYSREPREKHLSMNTHGEQNRSRLNILHHKQGVQT